MRQGAGDECASKHEIQQLSETYQVESDGAAGKSEERAEVGQPAHHDGVGPTVGRNFGSEHGCESHRPTGHPPAPMFAGHTVGKVSGATYGLFGFIGGAIFSLFSVVGGGGSGIFFGLGAIIILPILYGVLGFIFWIISAAIYNLVSGKIGGIVIRTVPANMD